ncbi:MAG: hypothetical protein EOP45_15435 [Sphingobacteriaceae bacterium]|nr:MAG: hypothetical protein EOP45_15435 [Sphingobacteriaceae bacterium]
MLEMMLHENKGQARIEYGSVRFIIKEGVHALPTIGNLLYYIFDDKQSNSNPLTLLGTKVLKLPKIKKKAGRKSKKQKLEDKEDEDIA